MKERPIIFQAPMVRAILDGRKTQERRVVKQQLIQLADESRWYSFDHRGINYRVTSRNSRNSTVGAWAQLRQFCPHGQVGDQLWVRETHAIVPRTAYAHSEGVQQKLRPDDNHDAAVYRADWVRCTPGSWRSSTQMPRWASRITLEITGVRVERLQDISEADAMAEGTTPSGVGCNLDYLKFRAGYQTLWESNHGPESWNLNPWVWVIEFKKLEGSK